MALQMKDRWEIDATLVANDFIDHYMAQANGEYVKVYLYILRHRGQEVSVDAIASALDHTESDVRRALSYWEKAGVLQGSPKEDLAQAGKEELAKDGVAGARIALEADEDDGQDLAQPAYSAEQVRRLSDDEEFSQLLYIAQKYLNKVFTPRDCQVFAYLYDTLKLSPELLEYLVEYCAQNGHFSVRYLEKVALNWHSLGLRTPDAARDYAERFNGDGFSVMKAFGLGDRRPAMTEQQFIDRWFREYGFSRELVLLACSRTITAIHTPSFQYADRILSDWKKAGVRTRQDVDKLDEERKAKKASLTGGGSQAAAARDGGRRKAPNQFHNFKERDTDYDALVLQQMREWVKG